MINRKVPAPSSRIFSKGRFEWVFLKSLTISISTFATVLKSYCDGQCNAVRSSLSVLKRKSIFQVCN